MKQFIIIILILSTIACNIRQNKSVENKLKSTQKTWNVLKTSGSYLIFQDESFINTRLFEMKYLETLKDSLSNPYFVLSGRTCTECDENIAIFIISPKDTLKPISKLYKYTYPGKEYDYETNKLNFESKLYVCNRSERNHNSLFLIWVQNAKNSNNKLDSSIFIVDIINDEIRERNFNSKSQDYLSYSLNLKNCREIKGIETTSEP